MLNQVGGGIVPTNKSAVFDKGTFLNTLMMMSENNALMQSAQAENLGTNLNILDILANNQANLNVESTVDIDNIADSVGMEAKEKSETEKMLKDFIEMNNLNLGSPAIVNSQYYDMLPNSEYTTEAFMDNISLLQNLKHQGLIKQEEVKPEASMKTEAFNFELKNNSEPKVEKSAVALSAEKLISEIETNRDNLKSKIDSQVEILTAPKPLVQEQNNIIKVSDESTLLKAQVLSQVTDKVTFMAEEGPEAGSTVKHVTMELNPNNLGKVDIKMTFENNKVTVEIKALNEETQNIISSNIDELAKILSKSSETVNIVFKSNDSRYEDQVYNYNNQSNEQNLNQDDPNYEHGRQKNSYYYNADENSNNKEEDSVFSQLISGLN